VVDDPIVKTTPTPAPSPTPTPEPVPTPAETPKSVADDPKVEPTAVPTPEPSPTPEETKTTPTPETTPRPTPELTRTPEPKENVTAKLVDNTNGLFPPVVISIPPPVTGKPKAEPSPKVADDEADESKSTPTTETKTENKPPAPVRRPRVVIDGVPVGDVKPCILTLDQDSITVPNSGSDRAVIVRRVDDGDIEGLTAVSTSPEDVSVRREVIAGIRTSALFVLRSRSARPGMFQVRFEAPCGKKEVVVRVQ
jgi:hypothetical protein